jgi:hypothetical protein
MPSKPGTLDDLLARATPAVADVARRLRALVYTVDPQTVEVPRLGERTVGYGVGPKKMSDTYAYIAPYGAHVNLGFYHGAALADPEGLLEGSGKALRHVKVRSVAEAERPALRRLLTAAIAERRRGLPRGTLGPSTRQRDKGRR